MSASAAKLEINVRAGKPYYLSPERTDHRHRHHHSEFSVWCGVCFGPLVQVDAVAPNGTEVRTHVHARHRDWLRDQHIAKPMKDLGVTKEP